MFRQHADVELTCLELVVVVCIWVAAYAGVLFVSTARIVDLVTVGLIRTFYWRYHRRGRRRSGTIVNRSCVSLLPQVVANRRQLLVAFCEGLDLSAASFSES